MTNPGLTFEPGVKDPARATGNGGGGGESTPLLYTLDEDTTVDSAAPVTVLTIPVEANKTYIIDVIAGFTAISTNGYTPSVAVPDGATYTGSCKSARATSQITDGDVMRVFSDERAADEAGSSMGTAGETPVYMKIRVETGETEGDVEIQFVSESFDLTFKAGTAARVRDVTSSGIEVVSADADNSSDSAFEDALSFTLEAGKTYLIDAVLETETAASTTGIQTRVSGIPANATIIDGRWARTSSTAASTIQLVRDTTTLALTGSQATPGRAIVAHRMLVTTTDTGGTLALQFKSEVGGSQVTVHGGSFAEFREVSPTLVENDVANTSDANYEEVVSVETSGSPAWVTCGGGMLCSGSGVDLDWKCGTVPTGGTKVAFMRKPAGTTRFSGQLARDDTAHVESLSNPTAEGPWMIDGYMKPGTSEETALAVNQKIKSGDSGTITFKAGSWALIEDVEAAA